MHKYPEKYERVFVRLGGFHIAENFMGAIGFFMKDSGLEEIMKDSGICRGGTANKILSGKGYRTKWSEVIPLFGKPWSVLFLPSIWRMGGVRTRLSSYYWSPQTFSSKVLKLALSMSNKLSHIIRNAQFLRGYFRCHMWSDTVFRIFVWSPGLPWFEFPLTTYFCISKVWSKSFATNWGAFKYHLQWSLFQYVWYKRAHLDNPAMSLAT